MPSKAKVEACRRNAKLSTGPKSEEGKHRSSLNSLRHGLRSAEIILADENRVEFEELWRAFVAEYEPVTATEVTLIERMAVSAWRLRRAERVEAQLLNSAALRLPITGELLASPIGKAFLSAAGGVELANRYHTHAERSFYRARHELERVLARRDGEAVPVPIIADIDVAVKSPAATASQRWMNQKGPLTHREICAMPGEPQDPDNGCEPEGE